MFHSVELDSLWQKNTKRKAKFKKTSDLRHFNEFEGYIHTHLRLDWSQNISRCSELQLRAQRLNVIRMSEFTCLTCRHAGGRTGTLRSILLLLKLVRAEVERMSRTYCNRTTLWKYTRGWRASDEGRGEQDASKREYEIRRLRLED